jgi:hypothetical protein
LTLRNPSAAQSYFEKAIRLNPASVPSWQGLGMIYASRSDWSQSIVAFLNAGDCKEAGRIAAEAKDLPPELIKAYREKCEK